MQTAHNLGQLLNHSASKYPNRKAIVFGSKKITYNELNNMVSSIACGLIRLGIKKQDKIALLMDNCPEFVIAYFSVLRSGAVVVPINYMFKIEEARYIIEDSGSTVIITSRAYIETAKELVARAGRLNRIISTTNSTENIISLEELAKKNTAECRIPAVLPAEQAVILYTSGTTGHPKGAELTHHNLISNAQDCTSAIKISAKDSVICILPLFHSFAATVCMILPFSAGAAMVIMKTVRPFKRVIRAILKNRVTIFVGIPSIFGILKDFKLPKLLRTPLIKFFNPVRLCISGAAALPAQVFREFEKIFRVTLLEGYGLTEASPVVTLNPMKGMRIAGSIGLPLSKRIKLRAVDDAGNDVPVGQVGELLVKGPNIMAGYYKNSDATKEAIRNNWLYTGDMAKFDSRGYAYIVGRKKEMVNVRGLNVYPREIEEVLYQNPKIKEAAVIGIPDVHKGEVPKAFIVLKDGELITEQQIHRYLRDRLAAYKIPKHIQIRTDLPKNSTGKILKRVLADEENSKRENI